MNRWGATMPATDSANNTMVTASGGHQFLLNVADTILMGFCGLVREGRLGAERRLLITNRSSLNTLFTRNPIDSHHLSSDCVVKKCAPGITNWTASSSHAGGNGEGIDFTRTHILGLARGTVASLDLRLRDRVNRPSPAKPRSDPPRIKSKPAQRGSAMIEFTVVGPLITMIGLSILQYGMLFFAKNQINHASFMAAREGTTRHADISATHAAYVRALVPLYGGGQTPAELANALEKATADIGPNGGGNITIEMLNPTKESFDDWNDPALQAALNTGGRRVIPNVGQAFKSQVVGATSGQTIQDANLIKLRITHGYLPKVPFVNKFYTLYLKWLDPETNSFHTKLVNAGRIPVVTHVTLQMQSHAIEPDTPVSTPGPGNNATPSDPGPPPISTRPPPGCTNLGCNAAEPSPPPQPPPEPPCNPLTDPSRCMPGACDPNIMCCIPR